MSILGMMESHSVKSVGSSQLSCIHLSPISLIAIRFDIVMSLNVNLRSDKNFPSASIAEVFPLLFAPTNMVVFSLKSMRHCNNFRKFWIFIVSIFIGLPPFRL